MIYLIGSPPRCGKTTLAKRLSKKLNIPWISCDTLDTIAKAYITSKDWPKKFPYSYLRRKGGARNNDDFYSKYSTVKIISVLKAEAKVVYPAVDMVIACEIDNDNDYIIEGYHLVPSFVNKMIEKYGKKNIKAIFLTKFDKYKFAEDVHRSTTPNDWLIVLTKKQETFIKVGEMVSIYSKYFTKEAKKVGLKIFNMDEGFNKQIDNAIRYLVN